MALVMTPIYTQTVGSGGASSITFNNIPQFYTDLQIECSTRSTGSTIYGDVFMNLNGVSTNRSATYLEGNGASVSSGRIGNIQSASGNGASATANTFGNSQFYIPNYSGSNFKSILGYGVGENNATTAYSDLIASLWSNSAAITSVTLYSDAGASWAQYSTFSLYGIIRQGA